MITQLTYTCSKSTIETIEIHGVILVFLLLTLKIFHTFSSVTIVDFEQINVNWVVSFSRQRFVKICLKVLMLFNFFVDSDNLLRFEGRKKESEF